MQEIAIAITGASGAQYGLRLLELLLRAQKRVYLMISSAAEVVIETETTLELPKQNALAQQAYLAERYCAQQGHLNVLARDDWFAPVASGSSSPMPLVICPASGGTISAIASGASNNLIERAADVALKERRKLIVVPRETPYSEIHLRNMLDLSRMGVIVLPASPGFYRQPQNVNDLVDFIVARILDQLGLPQALLPRWGASGDEHP